MYGCCCPDADLGFLYGPLWLDLHALDPRSRKLAAWSHTTGSKIINVSATMPVRCVIAAAVVKYELGKFTIAAN